MTNQFTEYGRVTFKGKKVLVGVEKDENGREINQAYFLSNNGELESVNRKTLDGKILTRVFSLGLDTINLGEAKKDYEIIKSESKVNLEDIDIEAYMPNISDNQYNAILEMLNRLKDTFPYVSSENLKLRLPKLIVEDTSSKNILISAFYKPKKNYFGMVTHEISTLEGKAAAIHELSHMLSARCEIDKNGEVIFTENVGFGDKNQNGIALTEGFNEMFSSLARCSEARSYETEVGYATLLYVMSEDSLELTKCFYEGNRYYIKNFGKNEDKAKKLVKNLDYHNQIYYYNMSEHAEIVEELTKKALSLYKQIRLSRGIFTPLNDKEIDVIRNYILNTVNDDITYDFTDSNFLSNVQDGLLDLYEDFMHSEKKDVLKEIATDSLLCSFVFSYNIVDKAKDYVDINEIKKNEERFFRIQNDLGLATEDIVNLIIGDEENATYTSYEDAIFDDQSLIEAKENYKESMKKKKGQSIASGKNFDDDIEDKLNINDEENFTKDSKADEDELDD